ncbi:MAG: hypothetical protein JO372_06800 [Solirubrobacterales bacterium]|nr:hypothetical protein [Solirubrobacterales bacterium]
MRGAGSELVGGEVALLAWFGAGGSEQELAVGEVDLGFGELSVLALVGVVRLGSGPSGVGTPGSIS